MKKTFIRAAQDDRSMAPLPTSQVTGSDLSNLLGYVPNSATYSDANVAGIPAIGAGIEKVANAVGTMLTNARIVTCHGGPSGTLPFGAIGQPINDFTPIVHRPNMILTSYEFWVQMVKVLMMRGNWVGLIATRDAAGYPDQVVPVHPDAVTLDMSTGLPVYEVLVGQDSYQFTHDQVIHVRSSAPVGTLWGMGIVEKYRTALEGQVYSLEYARNSTKTGGVPSAVIQLDTNVPTKEQVDAVQQGWQTAHGEGQRKPAVTGKAMTITPLSWSPQDMEFLESRKLGIAEAALMCGLRPEDLGASIGSSGLTYGNRTDDAIQRITDSYAPWAQVIEQTWCDSMAPGTKLEANPEALLRMSVRERLEIHALQQSLGVETPESTRQQEIGRPA